MHRRDDYFERFRERTTERGWTEEQQMFLGRMVLASCGSTELLDKMADKIFQIEDGLAAERGDAIIQYENVFNKAGFNRANQADYQSPSLRFDSEGGYIARDNGWDVT